MICPKCQSEYRAGFTRCADCGVVLIDPELEQPSAAVQSEEDQLVSVLETQDSRFLDKLITKLESKNIPYLLQSGTAFDWAGLADDGRSLVWKAALWVPLTRSEEVKSLIEKLRTFMASEQETE